MRHARLIVPVAAITVLAGALACKPPKTPEQIQQERQAAFNEGYKAFQDGQAKGTNPYANDKDNPHKMEGWNEGWEKAKSDKEAAEKKAAEEAEAARRRAEEEARRKAEAEAAEAARRAAAEKAEALRRAATAALLDINFDFDQSAIRNADKVKLQAIADFMKAFPDAKVKIEGHCDERGTVEYNLALGDRRAAAAKAYLVSLGVSESRLETTSLGKERPKVEGHNEKSWLANRRCEFKLL
ncbi:MAG: Peptidoglycan-associated lipoprotein precursor [Acidobacteria bacterium ADurb.Bin340]|jgi:peptidoglycan-associated lipoprotein|nr:MAG: Peptidoglycan-associated lipoprotein precursor [Acidobacteria bacterium ADurb.Bin340]HOD32790.1 OmpA family protein [Holophaga sp.]